MIKVISFSEKVTKQIGASIAQQISCRGSLSKKPLFILLEGNLGAGKTTFTKGFLEHFGIKPKAASPTFVIAKRYGVTENKKPKTPSFAKATAGKKNYSAKLKSENNLIENIWHIDAYRLKSKEDLELIEFNEIKKQPRTVVLIEWPGNVKGLMLKNAVRIKLEYGNIENERSIEIK